MIRTRTLATAASLVVALTVLTVSPARAESPRHFMAEVHVGFYTPDVDKQFASLTPYRNTFGEGDFNPLFGLHLDYQLLQGFGSLAVGGSIKYSFSLGQALNKDGTVSNDTTTLHLIPMALSLVYRFDWLQRNYEVPLVPYVKGGLTWMVWLVTDGSGDVASSTDLKGKAVEGRGGTFGWHAAVGLQIHLDWMMPGMAAEFDNEIGVNDTYLFAEWSWNRINDFGSSKSMDLSDDTLTFGVMFEF